MAEDINVVLYKINAELNKGVPKKEWISYVSRADETASPFLLRRPTGITSLDLSIAGGFPAGGVSQIAAPEGVGKNALVLQTLAQCQQIYGDDTNIMWCCTEFAIDKPFAHRFGVVMPFSDEDIRLENMARERYGSPELTDKEIAKLQQSLGNFVIIDTGTTAKRLEAVARAVKSNTFQIIVIDSLGAILTEQREAKELGEFAQQSSEAFLITEFQKKLWGALSAPDRGDTNLTTILAINQVRANRNATAFGKKWVVGGAYALKHAKLIDVWLDRGEAIKGKQKSKEGEKGKEVKLGKKVRWQIAKGKAGCHEGDTGTVDYLFDSGWDIEKDLVDIAIETGVIERTGPSKYALIDDDGEVIDEVIGKAALVTLAFNDTWFNAVRDLVLKKEGIKCLYRL
jgi:RecA/RadA recombinase